MLFNLKSPVHLKLCDGTNREKDNLYVHHSLEKNGCLEKNSEISAKLSKKDQLSREIAQSISINNKKQ